MNYSDMPRYPTREITVIVSVSSSLDVCYLYVFTLCVIVYINRIKVGPWEPVLFILMADLLEGNGMSEKQLMENELKKKEAEMYNVGRGVMDWQADWSERWSVSRLRRAIPGTSQIVISWKDWIQRGLQGRRCVRKVYWYYRRQYQVVVGDLDDE